MTGEEVDIVAREEEVVVVAEILSFGDVPRGGSLKVRQRVVLMALLASVALVH